MAISIRPTSANKIILQASGLKPGQWVGTELTVAEARALARQIELLADAIDPSDGQYGRTCSQSMPVEPA